MNVLIDIGNTKVKTGLFDKDKLVSTEIFSFTDLLNYLLALPIDKLFFISVNPAKSKTLLELMKNVNVECHEFTINSKLNICIPESYSSLGIDRVSSLEGAYHLSQKENLITIDFGTATTINVLTRKNFEGGVIAPGIATMFRSLNLETALLPRVSLKDYDSLLSITTTGSIASGVLNAQLGLISKVTENHKEHEIFITGGNSIKIKDYLDFNYTHEPSLNLYGIYSLSKNLS